MAGETEAWGELLNSLLSHSWAAAEQRICLTLLNDSALLMGHLGGRS